MCMGTNDNKSLQSFSTHLTTSMAKFPAAMDVRGRRHWITNSSYSNVSESQVDDYEISGSAKLFKLPKHQQYHNVACQTYDTCAKKRHSKIVTKSALKSDSFINSINQSDSSSRTFTGFPVFVLVVDVAIVGNTNSSSVTPYSS